MWQHLQTRLTLPRGMNTNPPQVPHLSDFRHALVRELGGKSGRNVARKTVSRYVGLCGKRPRYAHWALQAHLDRRMLPGVALYQSMRNEGIDRGPSLRIVHEAFRIWGSRLRGRVALLGGFPFHHGLIRLVARFMVNTVFPAPGWEITWKEVRSEAVALDVHRCFYRETLMAYDAEEVTPLYCGMDKLICRGTSPHVEWKRTATIGQGGDVCDFRFERA